MLTSTVEPSTTCEMSEAEAQPPRIKRRRLRWGLILCLLIGFGWVLPSYLTFAYRVEQMNALSQASELFRRLFNDGHERRAYPDQDPHPKAGKLTANVALRALFKEDSTVREELFGGLYSRFKPDGKIGSPPDYAEALKPGENHWMMVAGLDPQSPSHFPLLLENAVDATWPPRWLPPRGVFSYGLSQWFPGLVPSRGRCWPSGRILIVCCGGIEEIKLVEKDGYMHLPDSFLSPEGKVPLPSFKLLDVEMPE